MMDEEIETAIAAAAKWWADRMRESDVAPPPDVSDAFERKLCELFRGRFDVGFTDFHVSVGNDPGWILAQAWTWVSPGVPSRGLFPRKTSMVVSMERVVVASGTDHGETIETIYTRRGR